MKLREFELAEGNHFVAMEYYNLILNRTFLVLITEEHLIGLKVNGMISVETKVDPIADAFTRNMIVKGDLENPYSYMKGKFLEKLKDKNIFSDHILGVDSSNFKISRRKIASVRYDKRKKWVATLMMERCM